MKNSASDILNQFYNKIKLSEYLSKYLDLIQRGNSFVARCPFHKEKTPSFSINDEKGLFYCFGCGAGGNILNFISKYKNCTFIESLQEISSIAGINLNNYSPSVSPNISNKKFKLLDLTNQFFHKNIFKNQKVLEYLKKREINIDLIQKFSIGYCPNNIDNFLKYLEENGFNKSELLELGLIIRSKNNDTTFFGRFNDRIVFPIYNFANNITGFGGRTISNSKIKYINSPENLLFKKSENLYGFKQNSPEIKDQNKIIIVEGYLDVISLNSKKIGFSVASLGTSLSETQIKKTWNYVDSPYICYDGDLAGIKAMKSVALKCLKFLKPGKSLKFVHLPNKMDPDSYIREFKNEGFQSLMNNAQELSEFIWLILNNEKNATPEYIALVNQRIFEVTKVIEDKIIKNEYKKYLQDKKNEYFWKLRSINKNKTRTINDKSDLTKKSHINEMIILSFLIFESKIIENFIEEIIHIRFVDLNLDNKKLSLIKILSSKKNDSMLLDYEKNLKENDEKFFQQIKKIQSDHFKNLNVVQKKKLIQDIILNLRLPNLLKERDKVKSEIALSKHLDNSNLFSKHEKLTTEINKIKKKEF